MEFSPLTNGFYLPEIHGDNIPADAIEITDAEHAALLEGQSQGKRIIAGPDGHPELADPPPVDPQIAIDSRLAQLRAVREEVLSRLGGIAGRADRKGDKATADACDAATQSLLDITKGLPSELDAIVLEVLTRYKTIVTTAAMTAPGLLGAFSGVDL